MSSSRGSSQLRDQTPVSHIAGRFFIIWATRDESLKCWSYDITQGTLPSVQWLSCIRLLATPWTAACQASLSITNSQSLLKLMSIESVMPSNHLILCLPLLFLLSVFPSISSFPVSQFFISGAQSIAALTSASVLPINIHGWFTLGLTGWISLQSKGLKRVFNITVQKHEFFSA